MKILSIDVDAYISYMSVKCLYHVYMLLILKTKVTRRFVFLNQCRILAFCSSMNSFVRKETSFGFGFSGTSEHNDTRALSCVLEEQSQGCVADLGLVPTYFLKEKKSRAGTSRQ